MYLHINCYWLVSTERFLILLWRIIIKNWGAFFSVTQNFLVLTQAIRFIFTFKPCDITTTFSTASKPFDIMHKLESRPQFINLWLLPLRAGTPSPPFSQCPHEQSLWRRPCYWYKNLLLCPKSLYLNAF